MTKEIVLIHGAFAGPWCMKDYAGFFRAVWLDGSYTCTAVSWRRSEGRA